MGKLNMKGVDLLCVSPASTAICSSMDQRSIIRHSGRPIHRPRLPDRHLSLVPVPCSSQPPPISPQPNHHQKSSRKNYSTTKIDERRRSCSDKNELQSNTPHGSARYLLSDTPWLDLVSLDPLNVSALVPSKLTRPRNDFLVPKLSESNHVSSLVPSQLTRPRNLNSHDSPVLKSSSAGRHDQVVVLRVSLHCKGCESKVRKHISRMEGVKSFTIDLETKKVKIVGDVTPLGVLASVSRVKHAELLPSPSSP